VEAVVMDLGVVLAAILASPAFALRFSILFIHAKRIALTTATMIATPITLATATPDHVVSLLGLLCSSELVV
jgi:hypothetical protein